MSRITPGIEGKTTATSKLSRSGSTAATTFSAKSSIKIREAIKNVCIYDKTVSLPVYELRVPNVITPDQSLGQNDTFEIRYGDRAISEMGIKVSLLIYNRWGKKVYQNNDYKDNWSAEGLGAGVYFYEADIEGEHICKGWVQIVR